MARAIYKCRNKECRNVWAVDYPEKRVAHLGYGRKQTISYRVMANGTTRQLGFDHACSKCGRESAHCNRVRGTITNHVCDARCMSATGPNCECSCGGKNHGSSFICTAA